MSTNPYQPPAQFTEQPYSGGPQKPAAATVFGVLNILFGVAGLCTIPMSAIMFFVKLDKSLTANNPALQLMEENAAYRLFMQVGVGIGFIVTIVLIIAGIGLYQVKPYGRTLSIGYAIFGIVMNVVTMGVNCVLVFPALLEKADAAGPGPDQIAAYAGVGGGVFGSCVGFIYPALLLYFMYRPSVVAAFQNNQNIMTKS
jgi:hypothetical protein